MFNLWLPQMGSSKLQSKKPAKDSRRAVFPSVIVHRETILGRGHNRRVQLSAILHGEMDALENAHRQPASV